MTEIPEDIRKKAADLAKPLHEVGARIESDFREDVERALMDERERCARIAENLIEKRRGLSLSFDMIAAAIRSPDTAQGTPA